MSAAPATTEIVENEQAAAPRRSYEFHAIYLAVSVAILVLAMTMSVAGGKQVSLPGFASALPELCHSRRFLGIDCPGCGMTRCFISLGHGNLAAAWGYNPAGIVLFGLLVAQIPFRAWQLWRLATGHAEWRMSSRATTWLGAALAAALLLQWVGKIVGLANA